MRAKYRLILTDDERAQLHALTTTGKAAARVQTHARILLKADAAPGRPTCTDVHIREALDVSLATIHRVRQTAVMEGLAAALYARPARNTKPRKLDGAQEAHLVALTCSPPPAGHATWTLTLLQDKLVELRIVERIAKETIRQTLKKTNCSPGGCRNGASHPRKTLPS